MRYRLGQFVLIFFLACSCKKTSHLLPDPTFENGTITISDPIDSAFFPAHQAIQVHATVTGLEENYSFLKASIFVKRNNSGSDSLAGTNVTADGSITLVLPDTLGAGLRSFSLQVVNPYNTTQQASKRFDLYIGKPPAVQITSLETDDTSIVINWSKSEVPNFKAYEIYTDITEALDDRYPMPGTLIGRITNRDQVSFRHDSVAIYYRYAYVVKVVTAQDFSSTSGMKQVDAGSFMDIGGFYASQNLINDPKRERMYLPGKDSLQIIDPAALTVESSVPVPYPVYYLNMSSPDNLDCIFKLGDNSFQAAAIDLDSWQITMKEQFTLPTYTYSPGISVAAFMNNTAFFSENPPGPPFTSSVIAYNISNGNKQTIADVVLPVLKIISDNRIVVTSGSDSFLVFKQAGDVFTRTANIPIQEYATAISEAPGYVSVGSKIFDQSFNPVHQLPPRESSLNFILGFSDDGKYAVTAESKIINTTTWEVVRTYGGGTSWLVHFSTDNKTVYHFSSAGFSVRWQPPTRLYRFPWTH